MFKWILAFLAKLLAVMFLSLAFLGCGDGPTAPEVCADNPDSVICDALEIVDETP